MILKNAALMWGWNNTECLCVECGIFWDFCCYNNSIIAGTQSKRSQLSLKTGMRRLGTGYQIKRLLVPFNRQEGSLPFVQLRKMFLKSPVDPWYQSVKNVTTLSGYSVVAGRLGVMLLLELVLDSPQKAHTVLQYE